MRFGRYGLPYFILRTALGLTYLLIGIDIFRHPDRWIGFIPQPVPLGLSRETALQATGAFDAIIGLGLILKVMPRTSGWLAALHLAGILLVSGVTSSLIRDIGLLGAAVAIALWPTHHYRRKNWFGFKFWRRDRGSIAAEE